VTTTRLIPLIRMIPWPRRMLFGGEPLTQPWGQPRASAKGGPDWILSWTRSYRQHSKRPKGLPRPGTTTTAIGAATTRVSGSTPDWRSAPQSQLFRRQPTRSRLQARRTDTQTGSTTPLKAALMSSHPLRWARSSGCPRPPVTPSISRPDEPMTGWRLLCRGAERLRGHSAAEWRGRAQPARWLNVGDGAWRLLFHQWQCPVSAELQCRRRFEHGRREAGLTFSRAHRGVLRAPHTRVMPRLPASPPSPSGAPEAAGSAGHPRRALGTHNPRDG
jgi:hypothetical protein